jgi:Transglutaminase-like superfamily
MTIPPRFSWQEKSGLTIEIVATYTRVRWGLRRRNLPTVVASLRARPLDRCRPEVALDPGSAWAYANAVVKVLRLLPTDSRCLVRSLVLLALLAKRGIETDLVIGVLAEPQFAAHAWLEQGGVPLLKPGRASEGRLVEL